VKAQLLCRIRAGVTQTFPLRGEESVIGRESGIAVSVAAEGVSRQHAKVVFDGKSHWVEDLKSTNGTFVNGQTVRREKLYNLDVITLGKAVDLIFVLRQETQQAASTKQGIVHAALVPDGGEPYEVGLGEVTIGRSAACNLIAESGAVSKVHARVLRTSDQLTLEDLGSSNGTFVNGAAVRTSSLRNGDSIALGGVAVYRVVIEMGEVTSKSGSHELPAAAAEDDRQQFSPEWKTRFELDSEEYRELAQLRAQIAREEKQRGATSKNPVAAPAAASKPKTEPPPAAAKAAAAPKAAAAAAKPAPAPAAAPKPAPAPKPEAAPVAKAEPPKPPPPAPVAKPEAAPVAAAPAAPPKPAAAAPPPAPAVVPSARLTAVRLSAEGFDVSVTESGAHDLGRAREAALRIDHPTVSRRHARIILSEDRTMAYVQDCGGANGTLLNGNALTMVQPLADGDVVQVGQVSLKIELKRSSS
jgi:pSer/pThr/pTyr-binding forkhead associated (FHA) protein